ncbi:MAG: NAD-dependent malic enzyme [Actinomycetota bacterium]|nr:NAD-dependent malic enzyme [Actinomycetota bacterium]
MPIGRVSYSITMRLHLHPDDAGAIGRITTAVGGQGGGVTAVDVVRSGEERMVVDVTAKAWDDEHAERIVSAVADAEGVEVHDVTDRTFQVHEGGKLEVRSRISINTRDDLSLAYTPGVARVSQALVSRPDDARKFTIKGRTVAIVTDGSAVLGLGNIGPIGALPVMEGKAALFKEFADVDAWPVCLASQDNDEIVRTVELLVPVYGGVNLEDIAAPRCFDVEERLVASLDIPVFHDDQDGTAVVVLAALENALRLVGKKLGEVRICVIGAGAGGIATAELLLAEGAGDLVVVDSQGIIHTGRGDLQGKKRWLAEHSNRDGRQGELLHALDGADVLIGVSAPNLIEPDALERMADDAIVFALANPDPEVDPIGARKHATVVATGRSDYPNQVNNVLAFPGVFRGALDANASAFTRKMLVAAAKAIAGIVSDEELRASYIVPSPFNDRVAPAVARAVELVAREEHDS